MNGDVFAFVRFASPTDDVVRNSAHAIVAAVGSDDVGNSRTGRVPVSADVMHFLRDKQVTEFAVGTCMCCRSRPVPAIISIVTAWPSGRVQAHLSAQSQRCPRDAGGGPENAGVSPLTPVSERHFGGASFRLHTSGCVVDPLNQDATIWAEHWLSRLMTWLLSEFCE